MIWELIKHFIKKLPGIRYVVEGRERYIQLYTDLLNDKNRLERQLLVLEDSIAKREQALASLNEENGSLKEENRNYKDKVIQLHAENQRQLDAISKLQERNQQYEDRHICEAKAIAKLEEQGERLKGEIQNLKNEILKKQEELRRFNFRAITESVDSGTFWNTHYAQDGNSGTGSYNHLAHFKSDTVNAFLIENSVVTVLEIGCGDGNQLQQIQYIEYVGVDVSPIIVEKDRETFKEDSGKQFYCTLTERDQYANRTYDLTISMDVIFHLLEDDVFHQYLDDLFTLSEKFVVIYSSNHEEYTCWPEYRHRNFTGYIQGHYPDWELIKYIPNKYPYQIGKESETSASDFYFFRKMQQIGVS